MPNVAPLKIFLASPSDAAAERELVKSTVTRFNATRVGAGERPYEVLGWEGTRGTARRPQDEINELIAQSAFMIVLLKTSWGSDPGSAFGYTSGTEEELFTGLLDLSQPEQPMEDIWVAFLDSPSPAQEIIDLKQQIIDRHALLFEEVSGDLELDRRLTDRLADWQKTAGVKTARRPALVPRSGRDVLGAAKLRLEGERLMQLGQPIPGLAGLKEAARVGGVIEQLTYARALGRRGQLDDALAQSRAAISAVLASAIELNSTLAGEAFLTEAGILRRQGSDLEALNRLGAILGELDGRASGSWRVRARILDERGLINQHLGRTADASADFLASRELREPDGRPTEIAQSLVNLVRLEARQRRFDAADTYAEAMLEALNGTTPTDVHANAWTAVAQLRLREGRPAEGLPFGEQALALNEQTGNASGVAKSLLVLAECSFANEDFDDARRYAQRCLEANEQMGNERGTNQARWQLERLDNRAK